MIFHLNSYKYVQVAAVMARICVWVFVFLSAYGLSCQYELRKKEQTDLQFVVKRWISMMSGYWFVYIVIFALYAIIVGNPLEVYGGQPQHMILDIFGWADFCHTPLLLGVWWYMCLAQILIIMIPSLNFLCGKFGMNIMIVLFICFQYLPKGIVSSSGGSYLMYLPVAVLAVICAKFNLLDKIKNNRLQSNKSVRVLLKAFCRYCAIIMAMMLKYNFQPYDKWMVTPFISALIAFLIVVCVCDFSNKKNIKFLELLGEHSGNIFMIHAFFYMYCKKVIYCTHNPIISYCIIIGICLVVSIIMEFIKKRIHYQEIFNNLNKKIENSIDC